MQNQLNTNLAATEKDPHQVEFFNVPLVNLTYKRSDGKDSSVTLDSSVIEIIAQALGSRASAFRWVRDQTRTLRPANGRSISRAIQDRAINLFILDNNKVLSAIKDNKVNDKGKIIERRV